MWPLFKVGNLARAARPSADPRLASNMCLERRYHNWMYGSLNLFLSFISCSLASLSIGSCSRTEQKFREPDVQVRERVLLACGMEDILCLIGTSREEKRRDGSEK